MFNVKVILQIITVHVIIFLSSSNLVSQGNISDYWGSGLPISNGNFCKILCKSGSLSENQLVVVQNRMDYFRKVCNLRKIDLIDSLNTKAQEVAFLMWRNKEITHTPEEHWKCFNGYRKLLAKKCLLTKNSPRINESFDIISTFILDPGKENAEIKHRRILLFSELAYGGYGFVNGYEAFYPDVMALKSNGDSIPQYISWPPEGDIPLRLVNEKWSFAIPKSKFKNEMFSSYVVEVSNNRTTLKKTCRVLKDDHLDPTLIWEMSKSWLKEGEEIDVVVNLKDSVFNYSVRMVGS